MRKALAVAGAALAVSVAANAYQAAPSGAPAKPVYVQRIVQLLDSTNVGDWKAACDAAPTAAYSYNDYIMLALQFGVSKVEELAPLCERMLKGAATDAKGKPVGLDYTLLYWEPENGKPQAHAERLVIVKLHWHQRGIPASTIIFHVNLERLAWAKKSAHCKGKPCAPLRWYVLGAS